MMLAVAILAVVTTVTYMTFSAATSAWRKGTALVDTLHHGDFVMDQLVMALSSAYYPESGASGGTYGFWLEDNGDGPNSSDVISWVKVGSSLVGKDCPFAGTPHRVKFYVTQDEKGEGVVAVKAWRLFGQPEDFDPDELEPTILSRKVIGFNCTPAYPYRNEGEDIEWLTEWDETNKLPTVVQVALYLQPLDTGDQPIEIRRIVGLRVAPLSGPWKTK
jgi:hypothetical protein